MVEQSPGCGDDDVGCHGERSGLLLHGVSAIEGHGLKPCGYGAQHVGNLQDEFA